MGSDPVLSLDFNSRGEKPIIKCHWNFALQHDDISQKRGTGGGGGVRPCEWRNVLDDIGTSLSDGDLEVFFNNRWRGKRERGNQLALKWHLFCISAAFTTSTRPGWRLAETGPVFAMVKWVIIMVELIRFIWERLVPPALKHDWFQLSRHNNLSALFGCISRVLICQYGVNQP